MARVFSPGGPQFPLGGGADLLTISSSQFNFRRRGKGGRRDVQVCKVSSPSRDPFCTLGLAPGSSEQDIKRVYRRLALQLAGRDCIRLSFDRSDFSQPPPVAGKLLLGPRTGCEIMECQACPSRNISSVSFHEFSQDNKDPNFFERLVQAWWVLFPPKPKRVSNAEIAKQRLKMILISDRCAISDEAKRRIVDNVVGALSNFVEIESEEKVQLNVSADPDLGTVYSVIVPVRRVKPEYQDFSENLRNFNYGDAVGKMRTLDVRFEYPELNEE